MKSPAEYTESLWVYYVWIILGTVVVATWTHYIDPVINPDGVKYVLAGEAFLRGDMQSGLDAYKWPVYSMTIAMFSHLSGLSVETSALVFNAICRCLAGFAFIKLIHKLGANVSQLFIGAALYIFYPGLNEVQSMIIRDFAYLACFLWMVVFYVNQISNPNRLNFCGFLLAGLLATAYRIEGLVLVTGLLVLYLLSGTVNPRIRRVGLLTVIVVLPAMVYGLLQWIYDGAAGNAWSILSNMFALLEEDLDASIAAVETTWLKGILEILFWPILLLTPFWRLGFNIAEVLSVGFTIILFAGWLVRPFYFQTTQTSTLMVQAWKRLVLINLLVLVGFILIKQIVTDRYPISLVLLLMMFLPFAMTRLIDIAKNHSTRRGMAVAWTLGILVLLNSVEGLDRFSSKHHLKEAGLWIAAQSEGDYGKSKIYSNNRIVDYYAGTTEVREDQYYSDRLVQRVTLSDRWKLLRFLAITLADDSRPGFYRNFRYRNGKEPDMWFWNHKGDKVLVYDFRPEEDKRYLP